MPQQHRALVVLPQLPQDPASGAARSVMGVAELLAATGGWAVHCLGTTATESAATLDPIVGLRKAGIEPRIEPPLTAPPSLPAKDIAGSGRHKPRPWRRTLHYAHREVATTLLDTGALPHTGWERACGAQFDALFDRALAEFRPHLIYTFGGLPGDRARHARARAAGVKVVFAVCNHCYYVREFFAGVDAVTTPSEFLSARYRERIGIASTPLASSLVLEDVIAPERQPIFFTAVNPTVDKGVFFLARLAEELGTRRPDLPLLVIESRGTSGGLVQAGSLGGFDLRRHESLMFSPAVPRPRDIFSATRALLVPSIWEEPSARVVAEALVNGVPPLVSDRGGMAENCRGAGFVLPLPADLTSETRVPVAPAVVQPWVSVIERLADDGAFYEDQSRRARDAGKYYHPDSLAPRFAKFFERVLKTGVPVLV